MIKTLFNYSLGIFSVLIALVQTCDDIAYDYTSHPYQPYNFEHIEFTLSLEADKALVSGVATYTVSPKIEGLTSLLLNTSDMAIEDVVIGDSETDFRVHDDSLWIELPDTAETGENFDVTITWQSNSNFGLYQDNELNFWSSKNPLAHHHWLPVFDHPRVELTFDAYFVIPNETEVLFNGELVGTEAYSETKKKVHWQSNTPVSVTSLGFAMGDFVISEITSGLTKVRLFTSEQKFAEEERIELVREASTLKKEIESTLSFEYPWEGLNIVVLPDNYWEERTHGSGIVFLYENLGSLSAQLKRGMYAQWFGEYQKTEQYHNFNGEMDFMRSVLHYSINDEPAIINNPDTLHSMMQWNGHQISFQKGDELLRTVTKNSLPDLTKRFEGIIEYDDYAESWYNETGLPWFTPPVIEYYDFSRESLLELEEFKSKYEVEYVFDEFDANLDLVFTEIENGIDELVSIELKAYGFDDTTTTSLDFTGAVDTLNVQLFNSVEFVTLSVVDNDEVELIEKKPLFFLLNQLRSLDAQDRREAAKLLADHSDNPDLQLALNDAMGVEEDESVKAELLSTMAAITVGAAGTEERFISGLNSPDADVQKSSIEALANYPENDMVKNALRNKVIRAGSEEIFDKALEVYASITEGEEQVSLARRLERSDTTGLKVMKVLEYAVESDTSNSVFPIAELFLDNKFSSNTRREVIEFLLKHDQNQDTWRTRMDELSKDRDPRIRVLVLEAIDLFSASDALIMIRNLSQDEFDARILMRLNDMKEELAE